MTKKHFEAAAFQLRTEYSGYERQLVAYAYAELFAQFNPLFKRDLFLRAAEVEA